MERKDEKQITRKATIWNQWNEKQIHQYIFYYHLEGFQLSCNCFQVSETDTSNVRI